MKALLLILGLAVVVSSQTPDWKLIKEMSGDIPNHPGLTLETYATEIARGNSKVKLRIKFRFPDGAPIDWLRGNVPTGFDVSSIEYFTFKADFNCDTLVMKVVGGSGELCQLNGKHMKSKEPPFSVGVGHIFVNYFCERPSAPSTGPPTLKPK